MSMAYTAVAISVITAATSAYASYSSAENQKEMNDYNALQQNNAAKDANERGAIAAAEHRQKVQRMISQQNAAFSAGGINSATGTALDTQTDTAGMGELDALRIVNNAQREAAGYKNQSALSSMQGNAAMQAGTLNAVGSVLGSVGQGVSSYYSIKASQKLGKTE